MSVCRCDELRACPLLCVCVWVYRGVLGEGERRQVCVCGSVCLCVYLNVAEILGSCSGHAWETLWVFCPPPSSSLRHMLGHTQLVFRSPLSFFFSLLYLILWLLSQIIHEFFFFISQILFLTQLRRHCTCVLLSIYYMLSNCCHYCDPPPPFCVSPETTSHANSRHGGTLLSVLSTLLHEIDKCIGYWLSPMPTSTSIHCFPGPLHCPLSTSCPAGAGVSLAGLGARQATSGLWRAAAPRPSPCSLAPAGVSSGSSACQSDLTPTEREKKTGRGFTRFSLCKL